MPGKEKKWGPSEERDLAMAVILAQQGERAKYDWAKVHEYMTKWGYEFTRDAMSRHWTKRIMKDFKQRHGDTPTKFGGASAMSTPSKKSASKVKNTVKEEDSDEEKALETPPKKRKRAAKTECDNIVVK